MNYKKRVIVATDELFAAMGVTAYFEADAEFELLCVCKTLPEATSALSRLQPDVMVFGLAMENDLNPLRELQRASPDSSIVLWARDVSAELAHQAVNMGVRGFLSTTASPEHFKECLSIAARGELWMEQSLTMSLLDSKPIHLSKRQSELVGLLVQGLKNKEIAATLGISEGTVKAYLTTLYEKVGARDRFELALFGLKNLGELRAAATGARGGDALRSLVAPRVAPLVSLASQAAAARGLTGWTLGAATLIFAGESERFGLELKRGLPSLASLAMSVAGHATVITLMMTVRFTSAPPALLADPTASPTQIRIDKKLYYVARIEASQNTPAPVTPPRLINPVAAPAGKTPPPKPMAPPKLETPPPPVPTPEQVRQAIRREAARAFIPPEVKRTPRAEQVLIQPMSPPDIVPPPVPLPTFRVMTPKLARIPRRFVAPGQPTPKPPAQTPNVAPLPMELVSAMPAPALTQPRLSLPRTPPPPPEPVKALEGPPPAPEGEPLNILSLNNRNVPLSDRLVIPPGNIAPQTIDGDGAAAGAAQPAAPVPAPATPAPAVPSPANPPRTTGGTGPSTSTAAAASSPAISPAPSVAGVNPSPEAGIGRAASGAGTGAAITGATANGNPVVIVGGTATGPPPAGAMPGGSAVTVTGGANAGTGTGTPGAVGGGAAGARIAPGQIVTRAAGNYDTVVVQTSPVDQYPETRGLLTGRPIYSVYVSVGSARDWTLFFCIPYERPTPNNTPVVQSGAPAIPVKAPYATKLMRPDITLPTYERYVLVHGYVSPDGRFEELRVVRSIRPEIDRALLASLTAWEFRPASRNGAPVRVEFLLSIPARGL